MRKLAVALISTLLVSVVAAPARAATHHTRGVFTAICALSHRAPDDPIVYPNEPGKSHTHDFFGNTTTDAASTKASLYSELLTGASTCSPRSDASAYWAPVLSDHGTPVEPAGLFAWYWGNANNATSVQPYPPGLMMLAGSPHAMGHMTPDIKHAGYACSDAPTNARLKATVPSCRRGTRLEVRLVFADCWDGKHTDSSDHRAHVAYSKNGACPKSHPVAIPQLDVHVRYNTQGGKGITLASGDSASAHGDFVNAWSPAALRARVFSCLHNGRQCGTGGDLSPYGE